MAALGIALSLLSIGVATGRVYRKAATVPVAESAFEQEAGI